MSHRSRVTVHAPRHPSRATKLAERRAQDRIAAVASRGRRGAAYMEQLRLEKEDREAASASSDPLATLQQRRAARGWDASRERCLALLPLHVAHGYTGGPWKKRYAQRGQPQLFKLRGQ
jgi:hypothetical protein